MNAYLENTAFAAKSIIAAYAQEFHELHKQIARYQDAAEWLERQGEKVEQTSAGRADAMVKMFAQCREAVLEVIRLSSAIRDRELATQALCGALLQIAKQGISTVHRRPQNCPDGRFIGTQPIKNVIWQGRNQTMHYDDVRGLDPPVIACFQRLDADLSRTFSALVHSTNLATHVIDILGWHTYEAYEKDMTTLLP